MGTSSSYSAPTSGTWPAAKRVTTRFARQGGSGNGPVTPRQVVSAYVGAIGGAALASSGALTGRETAARLGSFFTSVSINGLATTLEQRGLRFLIGRDTADVLAGLADALAGPGSTLEESAARAAMLAVLEEEFGATDTYEELVMVCNDVLDEAAIIRLLRQFLIEYIYRRMIEELGDRIQNGALSAADAHRTERDIHAFIVEAVQLELDRINSLSIDWTGTEAQQMIEQLLADAYSQLQ